MRFPAFGALLALAQIASPYMEALPKIEALIVVKDFKEAAIQCAKALDVEPKDLRTWEFYLETLGYGKDEHAFLTAWKNYLKVFSAGNRRAVELAAWGVLEHGFHSPSPIVRIASLFGAGLSNDARGVKFLINAMHDKNAAVRATAIELASRMRDDPLKSAIFTHFFNEVDFRVRLELILALGSMEIRPAKPYLFKLIEDDQGQAEERLAAIEALIALEDDVSVKEVERFAKSPRAGFRLLACQLASHFYLHDSKEVLIDLVSDPVSDVRFFALQTLGLLRLGRHVEGLETLFLDPQGEVAIASAWVLFLEGEQKGTQFLKDKILGTDAHLARLAASTLYVSGKAGIALAEELISHEMDPFARLSIAKTLALRENHRDVACESITSLLKNSQERWHLISKGIFEWVEPSLMTSLSSVPGERERENIQVRLNCLNLLSIYAYKNVKEAIYALLQEKLWGVSAGASALLLTEGDAQGIDEVRLLLQSKEVKVRAQAALILSLWGKDEEAISTLEEIYPQASRELKERILEGLGGIASPKSIPFLAEQMKESSPILRIIAASSILQCLYR